VKAITFAAPIPRYLATLAAGKVNQNLYVGAHACTRFQSISAPTLPSNEWVRIRTRLGGICGSDLGLVTLEATPSLSPFSSHPFVIGHECVGEIIEIGRTVTAFGVGQRVALNPLLCCEPRGVSPPCDACLNGQHQRCTHFVDGDLPPGLLIGTTRGVGGSWAEELVAHQSQLVPVPESVSDREAVLIEPLACSVHAIRSSLPRSEDRILVIGAGSIGLLTIAALRALAPGKKVTVLARHQFQGEHARRLGAVHVISARGDYSDELARAAGARLLKPILGDRIAVGGFDRVFVCIGGRRGVEDALRFTRSGGSIVLLGNASALPGVDWSPVWFKELTLAGTLCYGEHDTSDPGGGRASVHSFLEAADLISSENAPIGDLVTHRFPLSDFRRALSVALDKRGANSVKVAFDFTG
jgi:L-iditol 2-dehydrogenase